MKWLKQYSNAGMKMVGALDMEFKSDHLNVNHKKRAISLLFSRHEVFMKKIADHLFVQRFNQSTGAYFNDPLLLGSRQCL